MITKEEEKFLRESNAIEKEYTEEAFEDAVSAWEYAKVMLPLGRRIDIQYIKTIHQVLLKRLDSKIAGNIRGRLAQFGDLRRTRRWHDA